MWRQQTRMCGFDPDVMLASEQIGKVQNSGSLQQATIKPTTTSQIKAKITITKQIQPPYPQVRVKILDLRFFFPHMITFACKQGILICKRHA